MGDRLPPLIELTRARLLEILREPGTLFWIFGFPVLMAVLLGLAFRSEPVQKISVGVLEGGASAHWVDAALLEEESIEARMVSDQEASRDLRLGRLDVVVEVAEETRDAEPDPRPAFVYRYDPTRPQSKTARMAVDDALQRAAGRVDVAVTRERQAKEPGARYIDFLIPGLVGLNLMGSSLWGIGFAIVHLRLRKILKRYAATPMRRSDFLLAMMLSRLVFLVLEVALILAFGRFVFGVVVRGALIDLVLLALLGSLSFTGLALLIAARPRTIEVASGWMNLVMIPMWLCSGSFFPYAGFPDPLQPLIRALPLTALNDALRSVVNEGTPLVSSWSEIVVLVVWGTVSFAVALRWFRWQ